MVLIHTEECFPLTKKIGVSNWLFTDIEIHVHQHQTGRTLQHCPFISIELSFYQHQTGPLSKSNWLKRSIRHSVQQPNWVLSASNQMFNSAILAVQQYLTGQSSPPHTTMFRHTYYFRCSPQAWIQMLLPIYHNISYHNSHHYVLCYNVWYTN